MQIEDSLAERQPSAAPEVLSHRIRRAAAWFLAAFVLAPLAIPLHELGHFAVARLLAHPDVVMHYGSVSSGAKAAGAPAWQLGLVAAGGPLVTMAIAVTCWILAARHGATPAVFALGLWAPVKFLVGAVYLFFWLVGDQNGAANFDEINVARYFGLPPLLTIGIALAVLIASWFLMFSGVPRRRRFTAFALSAAGAMSGLAFYGVVLGPRILP